MHELSIALNIVDVASEAAANYPGAVIAVHIQVGAMAGLVKEALLSAWELARADSPLERADLIVDDIPAAAWCPACEVERAVESIVNWSCSQCGEPLGKILRGRELEIIALEVEE